MFKRDKFQLVELQVAATVTGTNQDVNFVLQQQLQSLQLPGQTVYIEAIEVFSNTALSGNPITPAFPVATAADIQNATLTLVEDSDRMNRLDIPLTLLDRTWISANSFVPYPNELFLMRNCFSVSWSKSYVTLVAAPISVPFSYLFGIYYSYEPNFGEGTSRSAVGYAGELPRNVVFARDRY